MTVEVRIDDIVVEDRMFELKEAVIAALMQSIPVSGVIEPIVVRRCKGGKVKLVAGWHRYESCRRLGWAKVPVTFRPEAKASPDDDDLAQIDENLIRQTLTAAEESQAMKRRKDIYESRNPETKHGAIGNAREKKSRQNGDSTFRFTADTAAKTGQSERAIQRSVHRAVVLGLMLDKVKGTGLDKAKELDALIEMPQAERAALVERAAAGERVSAIKHVAAKTQQRKAERKRRDDDRSVVWGTLKKALDGLTDLARPADIVRVVAKIPRVPRIIDEKIERAAKWMKEFEHEWKHRS